jgi:hypothetical protein
MTPLDDEDPSVWELRCEDELIATITETGQDFPWKWGPIEATAAFESIRHLCVVHPDRNSAESARAELARRKIVLLPRGGRPVKDFTLQVDGDEAGFQFICQ